MRRWMSTGLILLFVVLALAVIWPGDAAEAAWAPNRPVSLICPWAAGGGTDRIARMVAVLLEKELKQPVTGVNRTPGGGPGRRHLGVEDPEATPRLCEGESRKGQGVRDR